MPKKQESLFINESNPDYNKGPVTFLGMTFDTDEEMRNYFTEKLREKLKDPEFRKIEGFPNGEDEDILNLSDPPYYTACPNPFIEDYIAYYGRPYESGEPYKRDPYVADVSEGKNDPIYKAHGYHTKVPHKAIMRYILHYTNPGDVVYDGFCGTGMTGVAAQMCGDKTMIESLGYQVLSDGSILEGVQDDITGEINWLPFSKLGKRRAILNDLSPIATFIAQNYNAELDVFAFFDIANSMLEELKDSHGWMYETKHTDEKKYLIDFVVWSEMFSCPDCGGEFDFMSQAFDTESKSVKSEFPCGYCGAILTKRKLERVFERKYDDARSESYSRVKFKPVQIQYKVGKQKYHKVPDDNDIEVLNNIEKLS